LRRTLAALATIAAAFALAAPASASVSAANACWWSAPGEWNNETFTLSGVAAPAQAAAGTPITLSGTTAAITLPREVIDAGVELGLLKAGENEIAIRAWLAIRGENTVEGTQVRETATTARTTITLAANGTVVTATPLDVTATFPDTQWTSASDAPVSFAQAPVGTLPDLTVPQANPGSIHVTASLGTLAIQIECQPGTRTPNRTGPLAAPAPVFASVAGPVGAPPPPPAIKPKDPLLTLRTTKLKVDRKSRLTVRLQCADAPCAGTVALVNTANKRVTNRVNYSLAPGQAKTLTLRLTTTARKSLRKRRLAVRITTIPTAGTPLTVKRTLAKTRPRR
jgi:hypothetical protein